MVWVDGEVPKQPFVSVTLTVMGNEPLSGGVPERTPLLESSVMPAGSAPVSLHVAVPRIPVAVKFWLKAASTVPVLTPGLVTLTVWQLMISVYCAPVPWQPFASVAVTVMGN